MFFIISLLHGCFSVLDSFYHYFGPGSGAKYCDQRVCILSVCMSICLSARTSQTQGITVVMPSCMRHICPNLTKFSAHVPNGRGSVLSDHSAICRVLPVLRMTSCLHIMGPVEQNQRRCFVECAT